MVTNTKTLFHQFGERAKPLILENRKIILQFLFTVFFIALGIWFVKHERAEVNEIKNSLAMAKWQWVLIGLFITALYILMQSLMYVLSFASLRKKVSLFDSIILFLKRNFISVFLPAGGVSSLAFYSGEIESKGIKKSQIHFASSIYGFIGILSVFIIAIPAFAYSLLKGTVGRNEGIALATVLLLMGAVLGIYRSIIKKGGIYTLLVKFFPASEVFMNDLRSSKIHRGNFLLTIVTSILIEICGITHLYIAMIALGMEPSLYAAIMGYIISVIFLIVSPFLRGFGAIEVSMAFVLIRFGFGNVQAIAITFLYRFFEFWVPLFTGILAFTSKINKILLRIIPALFLLGLGIINIVSVSTPAISERLALLKGFLPVGLIHASNFLVMLAGLLLLVNAAFMLKGLRASWWFAFILSTFSIIGNITKAIDFEEAIIAFLVIIVLLATKKEYYIKTNPKLRNVGIQTSLFLTAIVIIYGIIGFYYLDKKHFNTDFSLLQSVKFTLQNYFLIRSESLVPAGQFAKYFQTSINVSGFLSITFLLYTLIQAYKPQKNVSDEEMTRAGELLNSYGKSALGYFKLYQDKLIFLTENKKAFISYRISGSFAIVLENPVAENTGEMQNAIREFDKYCNQNGLKSIYYRVPEESLDIYRTLRKKNLFIGQVGVVDVTLFNLEGGNKKSLRNAINKVKKEGFKTTLHQPPVKDGVLQKIKHVSDEWLHDTGRKEIVFSQGMFIWNQLKQQTIITVENEEEKVIGFLNIVPDYFKNEATYDLIRKTPDAPHGVMDYMLIELFNYLKDQEIQYINIGFAPLSGLNDPNTFAERSMQFAYEKIRSFSQYRGLRDFKEKFEPVWSNRYLIYQHDYDLLKIPSILSKVIKP
ncbi:MAG: lysylphosphatidylglycerol synthetase family protein [Bacteroidales bacterium]|nr:lysylphosphatidylglycerol synthetase family protein [Bacteroidales bacterium]